MSDIEISLAFNANIDLCQQEVQGSRFVFETYLLDYGFEIDKSYFEEL